MAPTHQYIRMGTYSRAYTFLHTQIQTHARTRAGIVSKFIENDTLFSLDLIEMTTTTKFKIKIKQKQKEN